MDHFPLPKGARHIKVPYRKCQEYSTGNGGFAGYPARCGWTTEQLMGEDSFGGRSPEDVEAFFHTWLYFGVLVEVFTIAGVPATTADFLTSKRFVSTKNLPSKLRKRSRNVSKVSKSQQEEWKTHTTSILSTLSQYLHYYCDISGSSGESSRQEWSVSEEISMSLIALYYTIGSSIGYTLERLTSSLLLRRIQKAGWCPMDIDRAMKDMHIDGHYYMAGFSKPLGRFSHENCSTLTCLADLTNENTYLTKHTDECCNYDHRDEEQVEIDVDLVVKTLKAGGFPVVSWVASENRLKVVEFNAETEQKPVYVAISHVWADGMGNPTKNSLPRCQLVRLQRLVNNIASEINFRHFPIPFWIDTLCIPVAKKLKEYRALSIRRMQSIYKSASAVLVVESLISTIHWEDTEYEKSLRIYFSSWNRRLWTFQEGMLAQKLILQFADKGVNHQDHINFHKEQKESISNGHCVTFPYQATVSVMSEFVILRDFLNLGLFGADDYQALPIMISRIQHRNTTKLSDQAICASVILGKDPKFLLDAGKDEDGNELKGEALESRRMEAFLKMVGRFYPLFAFNKCPRLKRDGFRWGPSTLLGIPKDALIENVNGEAAVFMDDQGLSVKFPGMVVSQAISGRDLAQVKYLLRQRNADPVQLRLGIPPNQNLLQDCDMDREERFAIMFSSPLNDHVAVLNRNSDVMASPSQPVVVGIVKETKLNVIRKIEEIQIRHYCVAQITVLNPSVLEIRPADRLPAPSLLASLDLSSPLPSPQDVDLSFLVSARGSGASSGARGREGESKQTGEMNASDAGGKGKERLTEVMCEGLGVETRWFIL